MIQTTMYFISFAVLVQFLHGFYSYSPVEVGDVVKQRCIDVSSSITSDCESTSYIIKLRRKM